MKTLRYIGMAIAAIILTFGFASCNGDDDDTTTPNIAKSVTVEGGTVCSGSMPSGTSSTIVLDAPASVTSGSGFSITCPEEVSSFYVSSPDASGYYEVPVSAIATRAASNRYWLIIKATGRVTVAIAARISSGLLTPIVRVVVEPAGNTPVAVDLGLTSGTKWANMNVGATSEEGYGNYYAWGETASKTTYGWSTYKWGTVETRITKYCLNDSCGVVDNKMELDLEDDAAYVNWGSNWRTPSIDQIKELRKECTWTWTTTNSGIKGYIVKGPSGKSIFLPAAGYYINDELRNAGTISYYLSRTLISSVDSYLIFFDSASITSENYLPRIYGASIRPVYAK